MTTSEAINELAAALAKAQGEMGGAKKDAANPFFKSKYADLASVRDASVPSLSKHGISVVQFPRTTYIGTPEIVDVTTRSGETRSVVKVITVVSMVTRLSHTSGQWMEDDGFSTMLPTADPQAVGSATTYLRRYALSSASGVAPEDDDGEAAQVRQPFNERPVNMPASVPVLAANTAKAPLRAPVRAVAPSRSVSRNDEPPPITDSDIPF